MTNWDLGSYPYVKELKSWVDLIRHEVNKHCQSLEPCQLIAYSVLGTLSVVILYNWVTGKGSRKPLTQRVIYFVRTLPIIRDFVAQKVNKVRQEIFQDQTKDLRKLKYFCRLPSSGLKKDDVLSQLQQYLDLGKVEWKKGMVSGAVYSSGTPEFYEMITSVFDKTAYTNPLHADIFPGIRKMEAEIVRMTCSLYKGGKDSCGTVTTGGTESIFLACKAYREYAMRARGINAPEMVIPVTAHAAFEKAATILDVKLKFVPVDPVTMKVNMRAMKRAITRNTCMLVGSAPQFPHGVFDPIEEIANLGRKYGIPVHVDACLGGFLNPFAREAGYDIPFCDFTVPGVTSISADTHKYGCAPKGSSVIMYKHPKYLNCQYFVHTDWPGGVYASQTLAGSRAGGNIATCWAAMLYNGHEGYVNSAKKILSTTRYIADRIREIPGLKLLGEPALSVIAVGSDKFDAYILNDNLTKRGWNLNSIQFPRGFHLCVTQRHIAEGVADLFLKDLRECTEAIMRNPTIPATGNAAIYGMAQSVPDRSIISELACVFLDAYYHTPVDENEDENHTST